jgi:hypothetical protein
MKRVGEVSCPPGHPSLCNRAVTVIFACESFCHEVPTSLRRRTRGSWDRLNSTAVRERARYRVSK